MQPRQGSSISRCYARASERGFSDGRVKSWTLARRSLGARPSRIARAVIPLQVKARAWAPEAERLTLSLRRSGAGGRVIEAAIWRAVLAGGQNWSTYTASLRCATEPPGASRSEALAGARQRAVAERQRSVPSSPFFERSELMLSLPAKIGGGGRVGAQSGAERAPRPPCALAHSRVVAKR